MRKQYITCVRPHVLHTHWDQRMMYYEALILSLSVFFFMKPFLGFKAALFWNTVLNQTWKAAYSACFMRTEQLFRKGAVCFDIERNERKIKWREAIMRYSGCMPAPRGHVWGEAFMYLENTPRTHNNICVYGIENKTSFTRFNPKDFLWLEDVSLNVHLLRRMQTATRNDKKNRKRSIIIVIIMTIIWSVFARCRMF